jgi:hypothetical protein
MQFTTAPGKGCKGCLFEHERSTVCHEAARVAVRAGQPDCEYSGLIYVAVVVDERQLDLLQEPS